MNLKYYNKNFSKVIRHVRLTSAQVPAARAWPHQAIGGAAGHGPYQQSPIKCMQQNFEISVAVCDVTGLSDMCALIKPAKVMVHVRAFIRWKGLSRKFALANVSNFGFAHNDCGNKHGRILWKSVKQDRYVCVCAQCVKRASMCKR